MIEPGVVLQDTYRIDRLIGRGGMGAVFAATHVRLPKRYAIKVLNAEYAANAEALGRFQREAEVTSRLGHPNIVEVHDFNRTADGQPYIVMEFVEGEDLASLRARRPPFAVDEALTILRPVASALMAAHACDVVHRDLKPQNIIVRAGAFERLKLVDFGISKLIGASDLTRTTALIGTPAYMAPEQARGQHKRMSGRADQFALSAIAYELLTGRCAFARAEDDLYAILARVLMEMPPVPTLPTPVVDVLWRALAKEPEQRFDTVAAFVDALAHVAGSASAAKASPAAETLRLESAPAAAASFGSLPPGVAIPVTATGTRRRPSTWAIGAGVALAAGALALLVARPRRDPAPSGRDATQAVVNAAVEPERAPPPQPIPPAAAPAAAIPPTAPAANAPAAKVAALPAAALTATPESSASSRAATATAAQPSAATTPPAPATEASPPAATEASPPAPATLPTVHGDPSHPQSIRVGTTWAGTIPRDESAYLQIALAAGKYQLVVDTERVDHADHNLISKVSLLDADGATTRDHLLGFNEITSGYRRVAPLELAQAATVGFRVANAHDPARFWVTLLDDTHQRLVPFYGRASAPALTTEGVGAATLGENDDAFFRVPLAARTYKVILQLDNAQHRSTNLIAEVDLLDALGNPVKRAVTMNRIDVSYRQAGEVAVEKEGSYVLRVHNRKYKVRARVELHAQ